MALDQNEQQEYDELMRVHVAAGGNPDDPLDETTMRIWRWETNNQPETSINPNQIKRLCALHRKKVGLVIA